jgi:hypothetical protein
MRYATMPVYARLSTPEALMKIAKEGEHFFFLFFFFLFLISIYLSGLEGVSRLRYMILYNFAFFIYFLWWIPTRTTVFKVPARLKRIITRRPRLTLRKFTTRLSEFFRNFSLVVIVTIGYWAGVSRAAHIKSFEVKIFDPSIVSTDDLSFIFVNRSGPVFIRQDGSVLVYPNAIFALQRDLIETD